MSNKKTLSLPTSQESDTPESAALQPPVTESVTAQAVQTFTMEQMQKLIADAVAAAIAAKAPASDGRPEGFRGIWDETANSPTVQIERVIDPSVRDSLPTVAAQPPQSREVEVQIHGDPHMAAAFGFRPTATGINPQTQHANGGHLQQVPVGPAKTQIQVGPMQFGRRR